jgi:hypothetical protein
VSGNLQFYTPRQIEMAKQARSLYEMIGRSSYDDFVAIIKNNLLPHANLTTKGGKELGSLMGQDNLNKSQDY